MRLKHPTEPKTPEHEIKVPFTRTDSSIDTFENDQVLGYLKALVALDSQLESLKQAISLYSDFNI